MNLTVEKRLFSEGYSFDFFQSVRLLERLQKDRTPVGHDGPPGSEIARFSAHNSLSFPPSSIYDIEPAGRDAPSPKVTVPFLGLTGPSGVLPRHYTELLIRQRESKKPEKWALRDWFDLFNHRWISLFYRAWEKYRFTLPYERGEYQRARPDAFTRSLFSLIGLGEESLRDRLRVCVPVSSKGLNLDDWANPTAQREERLARIDDLALLHYAGILAHRPRCASSLEGMLQDYFHLPVKVNQFQGQWLPLDDSNQTCLGNPLSNNALGGNVIAGSRVWEVQSKIRIRLGPLEYKQFAEFLPERTPTKQGKAHFIISHLVRLYVGPEMDFDVQLILQAKDIPACKLTDEGGARLGWDSWLLSEVPERDAEDVVFPAEEVVSILRGAA